MHPSQTEAQILQNLTARSDSKTKKLESFLSLTMLTKTQNTTSVLNILCCKLSRHAQQNVIQCEAEQNVSAHKNLCWHARPANELDVLRFSRFA